MSQSILDSSLDEQPSALVQRLQSQMLPREQRTSKNPNSLVSSPEQRDFLVRTSTAKTIPDVPNMGALIHTDIETRMHKAQLEKFVNPDSLIYPFEVNVTLELPKPNDFMWDFKHNFYLSIMYSQVYRYFFPFNRHNSQLFFVTNEQQSDDPLQCMNIPSRIMFRSMNLDVPLENIIVAAISAYKDYLAFFRLNSKAQPCPEAYKNFCYVPPVWTNKLD